MNVTDKMNQCSGCGVCSRVCPFGVIDVQKGAPAKFRPERQHLCLHCGQCMAVCPTRFIQAEALSYDENFKDIRPVNFGEEDFTGFLASRRSVRNFAEHDVPNNLIQKVIDSIQFAPFGCHPEKISITVVRNRETIESALPIISGFLDRIANLIDNPVTSFFLKKSTSPEMFSTVKNHLYPISRLGIFKPENGDCITRGAPVLILFHSDKSAEARTANSLIDATYAMLQAHSLGLGATMVEVVPAAINQVKKLKAIFQIPQNHQVCMSLLLGYPRYKYRRSIHRPLQPVEWL